jgi:hypothetical protein
MGPRFRGDDNEMTVDIKSDPIRPLPIAARDGKIDPKF